MRAVVVEGRNRDGSRGHPSDAARRAPESAPDGDPDGRSQPGGGRIVAFGTLPARPAVPPVPGEALTGRTSQTFRAVAFGNPTAGGAEVVMADPADVRPPAPRRPDPPDRARGGDPPVDSNGRLDRSDRAGFRPSPNYAEYSGEPDRPSTGFRADAPPGWRGFPGADPPGRHGFPAAGPPDDRPAAPGLLDRVSFTGIQRALPPDEPDAASTRGRGLDGGSAQDGASFTGRQPAIREGEGREPPGAARDGARSPGGGGRARPGRRFPDDERARFGGGSPQAGEPVVGTAIHRDDRPDGRIYGPSEQGRSAPRPHDSDGRERERYGGRARAGGPAPGLAARPGGRRRGGRSGLLRLLQAALVLAVLVGGMSLGRTLALPGDAGTISRLADWGRTNHLAFLVDRVDGLR